MLQTSLEHLYQVCNNVIMFEGIILGVAQGITEWLPISSKGMLLLVQTNFFHEKSITDGIELALFLHLGTFLAALWYFRKDVLDVLRVLFEVRRERPFFIISWHIFHRKEQKHNKEVVALVRFLVVATFVSGVVGFTLLEIVLAYTDEYLKAHLQSSTQIITAMVGFLLIGTGILQLRARKRKSRDGGKGIDQLSMGDAWLLGILQGLAALPGFSRSGFTVSGLLLRGFGDIAALRVSFLMSLPAVLGGNILLSARDFTITPVALWGLLGSFIFGLLTIHLLLKTAQKLNFAWFVVGFGGLLLIAAAAQLFVL